MITSPGASYTTEESRTIGALPVVRATFLPLYWPAGVNADGAFVNCSYISPDRVQGNYNGFTGGSWISEVLLANLQVDSTPAVISWTWNHPGFTLAVFWRTATNTTDLASAAWVQVSQGEALAILGDPQWGESYQGYYQFKLTLEGIRAWAVNAVADADAFTAYAVSDPGGGALQGYAAGTEVQGDSLTYLEALQLLGEYTVIADIERAGTVTIEAPADFSDLVAGSHNGLVLSNRQGSWSGTTFTPAPFYSPGKSSFLFSGEPGWYGAGGPGEGKRLRIDLGWDLGGFMETPFLDDPDGPFLKKVYSDFITLFLGKIDKYGPINRAVDAEGTLQPATVEVAAKDFILDCLQKRIALPADDGTPQPMTYGEFICKASAVSGWSPAPVHKAAYFANPNYNELDHLYSSDNAGISLLTPGPTAARAIQFATTGASQTRYGSLEMPSSGEMFVTGTMTIKDMPATFANLNFTLLQIMDSSGSADFTISVDSSGNIYGGGVGSGKFNISAYEGVPLYFAMWLKPTNPGYVKLWINGDEVLTKQDDYSGDHPISFRFGAQTAGTSESWTIAFENVEVRSTYYLNAFKVDGYPFADIGPVYVDDVAQPDSMSVGAYVQSVTRYAQYGMVTITSTDPDFSPSGEVKFRVIENIGGRHALYIISDLLAQAGLTSYVDATALASAYVACPDDIIHARFEGGEGKRYGLKDYANMGITIGDCLKEILSRMMYFVFLDFGEIKIVPYDGVAPSGPAMAFTGSNMHEATQAFDLGKSSAYVSAIYGWYERNPTLFYLAGDVAVGSQGTGLDYSWGSSPVVCEAYAVVKAKADLLLKFLSAQELVDPVKTKRFQAARLELMDCVSISDTLLNDTARNYMITRKEITLDLPREISLQVKRFLGE